MSQQFHLWAHTPKNPKRCVDQYSQPKFFTKAKRWKQSTCQVTHGIWEQNVT